MTGPYVFAGTAPHPEHRGVGGITPCQISGVVTAPPQIEQVPIFI
jgi:hypothetical protein